MHTFRWFSLPQRRFLLLLPPRAAFEPVEAPLSVSWGSAGCAEQSSLLVTAASLLYFLQFWLSGPSHTLTLG